MRSINLANFTAKEQDQLRRNLIEIPRGDYKQLKFSLPAEIISRLENIYITFKNSPYDEEYIFQKTLTNNDITYNGEVYLFSINPNDTSRLDMEKEYIYDIELNGENLKHTTLGILRVTSEVTLNEEE